MKRFSFWSSLSTLRTCALIVWGLQLLGLLWAIVEIRGLDVVAVLMINSLTQSCRSDVL